jgi:apolipoprotein N-acyltransferase
VAEIRKNSLQKQNLSDESQDLTAVRCPVELVGIVLPFVWVGMIVLLILVSFVNIKLSSIISAENLILLTLVFSPVIYVAGATLSIIALVTSSSRHRPCRSSGKIKKVAFLAAALNIMLLVCWITCSKSFLMEFELLS